MFPSFVFVNGLLIQLENCSTNQINIGFKSLMKEMDLLSLELDL